MADTRSPTVAAERFAADGGPVPVGARVPAEDSQYDGATAEEIRHRLGVPWVAVYTSLSSTMDVAHALAAEGAPAGTLVLADHQTAGRGRGGRSWQSEAGAGIWLTLIERPKDAHAVEVLALRVGLRAALVLDRYAGRVVGLKWPNDLYLSGRKLAGVLIEARWQDGAPMWAAIGIGINVRAPALLGAGAAGPDAASLQAGVPRMDILAAIVPELRGAAAMRGVLTDDEVAEFARRDIARGRMCTAPGAGRVDGVAATGEIMILHQGVARGYRSGSLVLAGELEGA
jgi:BirA family transcriptional regulator, biotin operon repressor / biotin---[acetyl-CoA-carboxylase] ligase